mmetsp:Transcript_5262/g.11080  ORF Transcript_5262/g.11080 Transcript_5262/m.11080 type:complete len:203 (+) Transcript_5262:497-1105(+)
MRFHRVASISLQPGEFAPQVFNRLLPCVPCVLAFLVFAPFFCDCPRGAPGLDALPQLVLHARHFLGQRTKSVRAHPGHHLQPQLVGGQPRTQRRQCVSGRRSGGLFIIRRLLFHRGAKPEDFVAFLFGVSRLVAKLLLLHRPEVVLDGTPHEAVTVPGGVVPSTEAWPLERRLFQPRHKSLHVARRRSVLSFAVRLRELALR